MKQFMGEIEETPARSKIVLLGDQGTGKTSILNRFVSGTFSENIDPTIGVDFSTKTCSLKGKLCRLLLWDTSGQERFRSLVPSYIRDCAAVGIVYDVTNVNSFHALSYWVDTVKSLTNDDTAIVLIGNKADRESERKVLKDEGENKARSLHAKFIEVSAATGDGVRELFQLIGDSLPAVENAAEDEEPVEQSDSDDISEDVPSENEGDNDERTSNSKQPNNERLSPPIPADVERVNDDMETAKDKTLPSADTPPVQEGTTDVEDEKTADKGSRDMLLLKSILQTSESTPSLFNNEETMSATEDNGKAINTDKFEATTSNAADVEVTKTAKSEDSSSDDEDDRTMSKNEEHATTSKRSPRNGSSSSSSSDSDSDNDASRGKSRDTSEDKRADSAAKKRSDSESDNNTVTSRSRKQSRGQSHFDRSSSEDKSTERLQKHTSKSEVDKKESPRERRKSSDSDSSDESTERSSSKQVPNETTRREEQKKRHGSDSDSDTRDLSDDRRSSKNDKNDLKNSDEDNKSESKVKDNDADKQKIKTQRKMPRKQKKRVTVKVKEERVDDSDKEDKHFPLSERYRSKDESASEVKPKAKQRPKSAKKPKNPDNQQRTEESADRPKRRAKTSVSPRPARRHSSQGVSDLDMRYLKKLETKLDDLQRNLKDTSAFGQSDSSRQLLYEARLILQKHKILQTTSSHGNGERTTKRSKQRSHVDNNVEDVDEAFVWIDASGDCVSHGIVHAPRPPPRPPVDERAVRGRRAAARRVALRKKHSQSPRQPSSDNDGTKLQRSTNRVDNDASSSADRAKRLQSDNKLESSDNPKIREWLKQKKRLLRKQRREERRKARDEQRAIEKKEKESAERRAKSEAAVHEWMKDHPRGVRLLKKRKTTPSVKLNTDLDPAAIAGGEDVVRKDPQGEVDADFKETGGETTAAAAVGHKQDTLPQSVNRSKESTNSADLPPAGSRKVRENATTATQRPSTAVLHQKSPPSRMASARIVYSARERELPANAGGGSGVRGTPAVVNLELDERNAVPTSRRQLTFEQWVKNKKSRSRSADHKPVPSAKPVSSSAAETETAADQRLTYNAWLEKKKEQDAEKARRESAKAAAAAAAVPDEQTVKLVKDAAERRKQQLRGGAPKRPNPNSASPTRAAAENFTANTDQPVAGSTNTAAGDTARSYQWPRDPVVSSEEPHLTKNNRTPSALGRPNSATRRVDKITNDHSNPFSSGHSLFANKPPPAPESVASSARSTTRLYRPVSASVDNSARSPSPSGKFGNRPTLSREGVKDVRYQAKSWENFSQFVWDKVNEQDEESAASGSVPSERPEPQGADISQLKREQEAAATAKMSNKDTENKTTFRSNLDSGRRSKAPATKPDDNLLVTDNDSDSPHKPLFITSQDADITEVTYL